MIKMKIAIVFIICLTASSSLFSQRVDDMLSKEEMNKEFDYLIELVSEVNPHLPIYKQMMNYDVIEEMKKQRGDIDKVENWAEYNELLSSTIAKIPEAHTKMLLKVDDDDAGLYPYLMDSLSKLNRSRVVRDNKILSSIRKNEGALYQTYGINLTYIDGRFYNLHGFKINRQKGGVKYIGSGRELVKINYVPVLDFINRNVSTYEGLIKWDVNKNMLYCRHPTLTDSCFKVDIYKQYASSNDLYLTFLTLSGKEVTIQYVNKNMSLKPLRNYCEFGRKKWKWIDNYSNRRNKVICFDSILYIKILAMDTNSLAFFKEEISKYKGVSLKKVVIDVRDNGGGSDYVWSNVLSMIIDTTLCRKGKIGVVNNEIYRQNPLLLRPFIGDYSLDSLEIYRDPMMEEEYLLLSNGKYCQEIVPDSSSLRYKGQIYLLHNRGSFSSSIAFLTFALGEDRIIAIGEHNGSLGGYGTDSFIFQLPYSKLAFVMHSTIHIPDNAKSVEDYFWNKTEVEVTTTPEWEVLMYLDSDFFTPEILKTKDPFFKKVMELR